MTMPYERYDRQTLESINIESKYSNRDIITLKYKGDTAINQGLFIREDATTGYARVCTNTDNLAYLNWSKSTMTTIPQWQQDKFDPTAPTVLLPTGGLAGLKGDGATLVSATLGVFDPARTPVVGDYIRVGAGGKPLAIASGAIAGIILFGVVQKVDADRVLFAFSTTPIQAA